MVRASRTIKVNSGAGDQPTLTRSLVWRGLMMKAENPLPFVPVISSCRIIERQRDRLVREIVDKGDPITEAVTFQPERMVKFERLSGRVLGTIVNEIVEDADGDLALRFTFDLAVDGVKAGSPEEEEFIAAMEQGYLMAVAATLNAVRKLVRDGALATVP
jgi:Acetylaranotin biosynthesis cluster protein L